MVSSYSVPKILSLLIPALTWEVLGLSHIKALVLLYLTFKKSKERTYLRLLLINSPNPYFMSLLIWLLWTCFLICKISVLILDLTTSQELLYAGGALICALLTMSLSHSQKQQSSSNIFFHWVFQRSLKVFQLHLSTLFDHYIFILFTCIMSF